MMRRSVLLLVLLVGSLCAPSAVVRAEAPEFLSAVPKDAWVVVSFRDLNAIDGKIRKLMLDMKMLPISVLSYAKGSILEIVEGVDDAGTAALVVLPHGSPREAAASTVILVPTTDRAKLTQFIKPEPVADEPDYLKVTIKGQESYLGTKGRYSVIGASLEKVKAVVAGLESLGGSMSEAHVARFLKSDVCVLMRPAKMLAAMPPDERTVEALAATGGMSVEEFQNIETFVVAARLEAEGLHVEVSAQQAKPTDAVMTPREGSLLTGLPAEKFVLAMGLAGTKKPWGPMGQYGAMIDRSEGVKAERKDALKTAIAGLWEVVDDVSVSVSALPEGPDGLLGVTKVVRTKGPAEEMLRRVERLLNVLREGALVDEKANAAMTRIAYRRDAEQVGGVSVDQLSFDLANLDGVDESAIKRAFGKDGVMLRLAAVDGKYVVSAFGGGSARFEQIVAAVRGGESPLASDAGISASSKANPPMRAMEAYFAMDRALGLARGITKAMDVKAPIPAAEELAAPIAVSAARVSADTDQMNLFVPRATILAIKDVATEAMAGMIGAAAAAAGGD